MGPKRSKFRLWSCVQGNGGNVQAQIFSRRDVLKGSTALAATVFASPIRAAAPGPSAITPLLIEAAKKEGKVIFYTSVDLPVAEKIAKSFEATYSGISVHVERSGAERVFQRIAQEYASGVHAVDVANSSDASHFVAWKRGGLLAPYVPEDVAKFYPPEHRDPDGLFATFRIYLNTVGYNLSLVKAEEAPKSFADLLDPKWQGKIVKSHPSYSGGTLTSTYQVARDLGWEYLEKLAKQNVMQVQSSADPPKKLALGERAIMVDGADYVLTLLKDKGNPVELVYPAEGTPLVVGPNGLFKAAPNPNAARLFQSYCFSSEAQQFIVDIGGLRSLHPHTKERSGRKLLSEIKTMKDDAAAVERDSEEIKSRYSKIFGV
jgi:iron(III) transport system substrate-binding protein